MGTWEEESTQLFESHNQSNKDVGDDVDEVMNVSANGEDDGNCDGHECRHHENDQVTEEDALAKYVESLKLQDTAGDGYEFEEGNREGYGDEKTQVHPLRPYAQDCSFYIKTGNCKFAQTCRYNHPPKIDFQPIGIKENGFEKRIEAVSDAGMIDCKYFQTPGGCKYGDACRYYHSSCRIGREYLELNFLGLPKRPLAQECNYYLQHGSCAYGTNCKFHHPDPTTKPESGSGHPLANDNHVAGGINLPRNYHQPLQSFGGVSQGTSGSLHGMNRGYAPRFSPQTSSYQIMSQTPGWNQSEVISSYPANKCPLPHQHMNQSKGVDMSAHYGNMVHTEEFPKRPGQPDCDYFMKTGNCKYRSACKYNHPICQVSKGPLPPSSSEGFCSRRGTVLPAQTSQFLTSNSKYASSNGISFTHHQNQQAHSEEFPERAGQPQCEYYMKTGQCKFKSSCRYDHPRTRVPISSQCTLSEKGLPSRPGARLCRNYKQHGKCKYGLNCLFDHPNDYSPDVPDDAQFHSSTNVLPPDYLEPPVADNVNSAWDDGWGM